MAIIVPVCTHWRSIYVLLIPRLLGRYSKYPKECEIIPRAQPEGLSHIPEGVCRTPVVGVV